MIEISNYFCRIKHNNWNKLIAQQINQSFNQVLFRYINVISLKFNDFSSNFSSMLCIFFELKNGKLKRPS